MLQILGFRAPGKANLPGTLGPRCRDLVPTFRAGCFLKSTVPAFSSFSDSGATVLDIQSRYTPHSYSLSPDVLQLSQGIALYPSKSQPNRGSQRGIAAQAALWRQLRRMGLIAATISPIAV